MYLTNETKTLLERNLGKRLSDIKKMDLDEEISFIEEKTGKKIRFTTNSSFRFICRGNPLLAHGRIITKEQEDKWFKKLK